MTDTPTPFYQRRPLAVVVATLAFIVAVAVALAMLAHTFVRPAHANDVVAYPMNSAGWSLCTGGFCAWGEGSPPNPYVRTVPQPESQADKDAAVAREHKWVEDCKPALVRDRYGVQRYTYSKSGCEFGSPE